MKLLVIGGEGTIGRKVVGHFAAEHEVISAGRSSGELTVDISDSQSIVQMFVESGMVDGVVCIAGEAKWDTFDALEEEDYYIGIRSKLMGQVNLVRIAKKFVNDGGSITLSTGILADDPVPMTASAAMVNGAIHSFVKAASLEIERGVRINAVSLGLVEDSVEKYQKYFPGHSAISMQKVIEAYEKSISSESSGEVIRMYS